MALRSSSSEPATMIDADLPAPLLSDRSDHVGDQYFSVQIVQLSDALGAPGSHAQRTLPRSATKHPECRSRTGAGVDHRPHRCRADSPGSTKRRDETARLSPIRHTGRRTVQGSIA